MRIAFITSQFPGIRMGGIGGYTLSAGAALASLGHDVHIFTFLVPQDAQPTPPAGATVHFIPDLAARIVEGSTSSELAAALGSGGEPMHRLSMGTLLADAVLAQHDQAPFDIVEGPEYEGLTLPLLWRLQNRAARPAVITHIHSGSSINRRGNDQKATDQDAAIDAIERASIILADARCAATTAVVRETRVTLPFENPVEIIPLGIAAVGPYTPPPAEGSILFIGRLERLKGVDNIIRAADIFLRKFPEASIKFIGPDTPTAPLSSSERSMKAWMLQTIDPALRSRILFTGEIPPDEVAQHLLAAKFVVAPSLFENFSLVASQAIAAGRPVITTEGIGTVEVIGDTGLTFPRDDSRALAAAMERLWTSQAFLNELSQAAYHRAQTAFSLEDVPRKRAQFYEQAIAAKQPIEFFALRRKDLALLDPLLSIAHALCGLPRLEDKPTPSSRLLKLMQRIAKETGVQCTDVILYGAGRFSARLLAGQYLWTSRGHAVIAFLDDNPRWKNGGTHLGIFVVQKKTLLARINSGASIPPVVLATDAFEDQFWNQTAELRERGVRVYRLSDA